MNTAAKRTTTRQRPSGSRQRLPEGTRVRIRVPAHTLTLRAHTGTIVQREDEYYYIVRLDQPAYYDNGVQQYELAEIREMRDNFDVLDLDPDTLFVPTVVRQYVFIIDFTQPHREREPAEMYRDFLQSMTQARPLHLAFMHEGKRGDTMAKIIGIRQAGPDLYEVTAVDAEGSGA